MKSLFKVTLLATTMAVALYAPSPSLLTLRNQPLLLTAAFKNDDQSRLRAGRVPGSLYGKLSEEQEKLGIKLDKDQLDRWRSGCVYEPRANCLTRKSNKLCRRLKHA